MSCYFWVPPHRVLKFWRIEVEEERQMGGKEGQSEGEVWERARGEERIRNWIGFSTQQVLLRQNFGSVGSGWLVPGVKKDRFITLPTLALLCTLRLSTRPDLSFIESGVLRSMNYTSRSDSHLLFVISQSREWASGEDKILDWFFHATSPPMTELLLGGFRMVGYRREERSLNHFTNSGPALHSRAFDKTCLEFYWIRSFEINELHGIRIFFYDFSIKRVSEQTGLGIGLDFPHKSP